MSENIAESQEELKARIPYITKMGTFTAYKSILEDKGIDIRLEGFEFDCREQPKRIAIELYCAILIQIIESFGNDMLAMSDEAFEKETTPGLNIYNNVGTKTFYAEDNLPDDSEEH